MIAIQKIINIICEQYKITCGEINIYCNNNNVLCKNKPETTIVSYPRFSSPNVDLKYLLWHLRDEKPNKLELSLKRIEGHQDRNHGFNLDEAPKSVKLNIEMDGLAKSI